MNSYRAEALVLKSQDLNEADKLLTLFSLEDGKIRAVARGARRSRNRLLAPSQPFSHSHLLLFPGKGLDTVSQGEITESFRSLREDLTKMVFSSYAAELVDEFSQERDKSPAVFYLLLEFFRFLSQDKPPEIGLRFFQLQLLTSVGFRPELGQCVNCGAVLDGGAKSAPPAFSPALGGVLCPRCSREAEKVMGLSAGGLASLQFLLTATWPTLSRFRPQPEQMAELERLLEAYIDERLEKRPRAREFLHLAVKPDEI
ncbi:MAG: DNA repair protein RecO [Firmicutes bacterium]|nr:DNA repair protein RecO [Bacillota bacterium]